MTIRGDTGRERRIMVEGKKSIYAFGVFVVVLEGAIMLLLRVLGLAGTPLGVILDVFLLAAGVVAGGVFFLKRPFLNEYRGKEETLRDLEELSRLGGVVFYRARVAKGSSGRWEPRVEFVSRSAREVLGYDPAEVGPDFRWWMERIHPDERERVVSEAYAVFSEGEGEQVYRFRDASGNYQWVRDRYEVTFGPGGVPAELRGVWVVVTEEAERERRLEKVTLRLETMLRAAERINRSLQVDEVLKNLVLSALELVDSEAGGAGVYRDGKVVFTRYIEREREHQVRYEFPPGRGVPGWVLENRKPYITNDAARDPVVIREIQKALGFRNLIDVPILDPEGNVLGCFEIHNKRGGGYTEEDVFLLTALAEVASVAMRNALMMEKIRETTERQRLLYAAIEQAGEAVMLTDAERKIIYVNPAFERVTGYSRDEVLGKTPAILRSGAHPPEFYEDLHGKIYAGQTWQGTFVNRKKDGSLYTEDAVISPVTDEEGNITHFVSVKRDVTEKMAMEEQLRHSQKLESVGRLAGGIAHDINNYLSALAGYAEVLKMRYRQEREIQEKLEKILDTVFRCSDLIAQLLAFSRKTPSSPRVVDVNERLETLRKMLSRLIGERIEFSFIPGEGDLNVKIDPLHLEQVVVNLVVNARDAMPDGGRLVIETRKVLFDDAYLRKRPLVRPGEYVMVSVSDTGVGIPKEIQDRIFEPFFTTKGKERGSGLGLSTVYGIVKQNNGYIWVYSEPGKGTTFKVYFPLCREEAEEIEGSGSPPPRLSLSGRRILYVEDNEDVRTALVEFLRGEGAEVVSATSAEEALEVSQGKDFHLLITDVVMPGKSGRELADILKARQGTLRVLFTTGYSDREVIRFGVSGDEEVLLRKPFRREELLEKVRLLLQDDSTEAS
ncbi:MAG: PAS domain S-box protein [Deltaproteobacteria bacterium]|nr:MAG: PAS domain S-box protein [Deltaproteobacteria bacterium]